MNISLPAEWERFANDLVATGRYVSTDEVILIALTLLKDQEDLCKIKIAELRKDIAIGLEQADRGELLDGVEVFQRVREKLKARTVQDHEPLSADAGGQSGPR